MTDQNGDEQQDLQSKQLSLQRRYEIEQQEHSNLKQEFAKLQQIMSANLKENQQLQERNAAIMQEKNLIKENLLKYWLQVSQSLNDDFEEILNLGRESDSLELLSALLIIEEARQDQSQSDKMLIAQLKEENESQNSQTKIDHELTDTTLKNGNNSNEVKDLEKQLRDLSYLILEDKKKSEVQERKLNECQDKLNDKIEEVRTLEKQINNLTLQLVACKEEKIDQITQSQNQIQVLKEKELDYTKQIQNLTMKLKKLQIKQIRFEDNGSPQRNSARQSFEGSDSVQPVQFTKSQHMTNSPQLSGFRPLPIANIRKASEVDLVKSAQAEKQSSKVERVLGISQSQLPYRFGK